MCPRRALYCVELTTPRNYYFNDSIPARSAVSDPVGTQAQIRASRVYCVNDIRMPCTLLSWTDPFYGVLKPIVVQNGPRANGVSQRPYVGRYALVKKSRMTNIRQPSP